MKKLTVAERKKQCNYRKRGYFKRRCLSCAYTNEKRSKKAKSKNYCGFHLFALKNFDMDCDNYERSAQMITFKNETRLF